MSGVDDAFSRARARIDPDTGVFRTIAWSELLEIVGTGKLDQLTRSPTQLSEYREWKKCTMERYGSIEKFLLDERLDWTLPLHPQGTEPFEVDSDWKCLRNDFPYALSHGITHLVIWSKVPFPTTSSGELTDSGKNLLETFLFDRLFSNVPRDQVIYFLNPPNLKSIGNLEHFHVLLNGIDGEKYVTSSK